jgi:uncharacterized phage protein (TIGR02216 family)
VSAFDWPALLRTGLQQLGLKPREFWDLTPLELRLMLGDAPDRRPLGRSRLEALMQAFPDAAGTENRME